MANTEQDKAFGGSIPRLYEQYLVPLIFGPYAADVATRLKARAPKDVLEVAAGTGVVTRQLAAQLPASVNITATDLNPPMLDHARELGTERPVQWQPADAQSLPFPDASFDAVVCQFGVMFFPDKAKAFSEAHRVLRPGGVYVFNVWDRLEDNDFADAITQALAALFPAAPPRFLARTPYGYHDRAVITRELAQGGFTQPPQIDTVTARSRAPSPEHPAIAYCQGTPLRNDIESLHGNVLDAATQAATAAIARRFGSGPVDGKIQALVFTVTKPA